MIVDGDDVMFGGWIESQPSAREDTAMLWSWSRMVTVVMTITVGFAAHD